MVKVIQSDEIFFLLKFLKNKPQYLDDFKNGRLYFSSLQSFVDLETKEGNKKTGDKNEGNIHKVFTDFRNFDIAGIRITERDLANNSRPTLDISMTDSQRKNIGVCSFFAVQFKDLEKDECSGEYHLGSKVIEDLYKTKDGNRILFGVNNVRSLQKECIENRLSCGLVRYYDPRNLGNINKLKEHPEFYKTNNYSFQHEFRIVKSISNGTNMKYLQSIETENFENNILDNYK